jgi:hypothetical protein
MPATAVLLCIVFATSATPRDLIAGRGAWRVGRAVFKLRRCQPG